MLCVHCELFTGDHLGEACSYLSGSARLTPLRKLLIVNLGQSVIGNVSASNTALHAGPRVHRVGKRKIRNTVNFTCSTQ